MKHKVLLGFAVCVSVCFFASSGWSQEGGSWWEQSSLTLPEHEKPLRWHLELGGGGDYFDGNESGDYITGRWLGVMRSGRLSFYFDGSADYQDKDYGQLGQVREVMYFMRGMFRYDLYKELYGAIGVVSERDDQTFVARRDSVFAGLGQRYKFSDNVSLQLLTAFGREESRYDEDVAAAFSVETTTEQGNAFIFTENASYQVTSNLSVEQDGMYVAYVDGDLDNRWSLGGGPVIQIAPKLSLIVRYDAWIEDNPVLQAISGEDFNQSVKVMFRLNYGN